jgi:hypothetical protein
MILFWLGFFLMAFQISLYKYHINKHEKFYEEINENV